MKYAEAKKLGDLSETPLVGSRTNVDRAIQIGEAVDKHRVEHFDELLSEVKELLDCNTELLDQNYWRIGDLERIVAKCEEVVGI